jgi:hypothetical protein
MEGQCSSSTFEHGQIEVCDVCAICPGEHDGTDSLVSLQLSSEIVEFGRHAPIEEVSGMIIE